MTDINCHFFRDVEHSESHPSSTEGVLCQRKASTFVRVLHTGRLCPLCSVCEEKFVAASKSMGTDVKKNVPGNGEYQVVSLADGADEFTKQTPK